MRRLALLILLAGCHDWDSLSSIQDFSGKYAIIMTNGQNGCLIGGPSSNWMPGMMSDAITLDVQQTGANHDQIDAQIGGVVGDFINFFCGSKDLIGTATHEMNASIMCTKDTTVGSCTFRYLAHAQATLNGNTITGHIDYTTVITSADSPDCTPYRNCTSSQTFTGNR
jgi:hypothetical protein